MNHYTQLLYFLKQLAESHPLVNTVTQGNADNIDLEKSNIFPLVHLTIEDANFTNGKTLVFPVTIECLTERDFNKEVIDNKFWKQDNEVDNHNETLAILNYMWTALYRDWNQNNLTTTEDATVTKIEFAKGNVLDGWSLAFEVEVPNTDLCLELVPDEVTVTLSSTTGGTATSSLGVESDSPFTLDKNTNTAFNATPETGYRFRYWLLNGIQNLINPLALIITKSYDVVANFIKTWQLTTSVDGNGTISPVSGVYDDGTEVTITATPSDEDTTLDRIEKNNIVVSNTSPYIFTIEEESNVIAYFTGLLTIVQDILSTIPIKVADDWVGEDQSGIGNNIIYKNTQIASFNKNGIIDFLNVGYGTDFSFEVIFYLEPGTQLNNECVLGGRGDDIDFFSYYSAGSISKSVILYKKASGFEFFYIPQTLARGQWHHVTFNKTGLNLTMSVNGTVYNQVASGEFVPAFDQLIIAGNRNVGGTIQSTYYLLGSVAYCDFDGKVITYCENGIGDTIYNLGTGENGSAINLNWGNYADLEPYALTKGVSIFRDISENQLNICYKNGQPISFEVAPIIILSGQSNAVGTFDTTTLAEVMALLPVEYQGSQNNIKMYWEGDYLTYDPTSGAFENMEAPNNTRDYTYTNPADPAYTNTGWGFEQKASHLLQAQLNQTVYVIKVARGGMAIDHWQSPSGDLWVMLKRQIEGAIDWCLKHNKVPYFVDLGWVQGESDIIEGTTATYETNLRNLITNIRGINATYTANIPFTFFKLSNNNGLNATDKNTINTAFETIAGDTSLCKTLNTDNQPFIDNNHYDMPAWLDLAEDWFQLMDTDISSVVLAPNGFTRVGDFPVGSGILKGLTNTYLGVKNDELVEQGFDTLDSIPTSSTYIPTKPTSNNISRLIIKQ